MSYVCDSSLVCIALACASQDEFDGSTQLFNKMCITIVKLKVRLVEGSKQVL